MSKTSISELNRREQRIYQALDDGVPHSIDELKRLFVRDARRHLDATDGKASSRDVNRQAQSFVRNSLRKLVRLGWVKGSAQDARMPKGTYKLAKAAKAPAKAARATKAAKAPAKAARAAKAAKAPAKAAKAPAKAARAARAPARGPDISGYNAKEQRLVRALSDGTLHTIGELKRLFVRDAKRHLGATNGKASPGDVDRQAQSLVRNSLRRLVKDDWVEGTVQNAKIPRGAYRLTRAGKTGVKRA